MPSGGPPYYGRWPVNAVYEARLDNTWVDATPQRAIVSGTPAPSFTKTEYAGYVVMTFTASGTVTFSGDFGGTGQALLVGGGSGGAGGGGFIGGNGGIGGSVRTISLPVSANTPIPVTVGAAGVASSVGSQPSAPGTTAPGGPGSSNPTNGTNGTQNDYRTGSNQYYGGGGGGGGTGSYQAGPMTFSGGPIVPGSGGAGGGGPGGYASTQFAGPGSPGQANTGGGGGGGAGHVQMAGFGQTADSGSGGSGGSGIVVLRFPTVDFRSS